MTKHPVHCFSLGGYWLSIGIFNGGLLLGAFGLYLYWGLRFAQERLMMCGCGPYSSFLLLKEVFPADMPLTYLLNWLVVFAAGVVIEFLILFCFHPKTKRALLLPLLAFVHNLPGVLMLLTLMSQPDYFAVYLTATIFALPLVGIYTPFLRFHPTDPRGARATQSKLLDLLTYFGLAYVLLTIVLAFESFFLLPLVFLFAPLFLLHPFYFFILLFMVRRQTWKKSGRASL